MWFICSCFSRHKGFSCRLGFGGNFSDSRVFFFEEWRTENPLIERLRHPVCAEIDMLIEGKWILSILINVALNSSSLIFRWSCLAGPIWVICFEDWAAERGAPKRLRLIWKLVPLVGVRKNLYEIKRKVKFTRARASAQFKMFWFQGLWWLRVSLLQVYIQVTASNVYNFSIEPFYDYAGTDNSQLNDDCCCKLIDQRLSQKIKPVFPPLPLAIECRRKKPHRVC